MNGLDFELFIGGYLIGLATAALAALSISMF